MYYFNLLFVLIGLHFLCDFSFQSPFIAEAKNPTKPIPGITWQWVMFAHCMIHATFVYLATGKVIFGLFELAMHLITDISKCRGWFGEGNKAFNIDQTIHLICKVIWVYLLFVIKTT